MNGVVARMNPKIKNFSKFKQGKDQVKRFVLSIFTRKNNEAKANILEAVSLPLKLETPLSVADELLRNKYSLNKDQYEEAKSIHRDVESGLVPNKVPLDEFLPLYIQARLMYPTSPPTPLGTLIIRHLINVHQYPGIVLSEIDGGIMVEFKSSESLGQANEKQ